MASPSRRDGTMTAKVPRYAWRLSDHILVAFHQACDQGDLEVAEQLLKVLDMLIAAPRLPRGGSDRRE